MSDAAQNEFIEDNLMIVSKQTMELFLKQKDPARCISLYLFYYYTAKWQKTNQIRCTIDYTAMGIKWNEDTVRKFKKILIELELIEDIKDIDPVTKKVKAWYVKLNYIWKKTYTHPPQLPEGGLSQRVDLRGTNALSANNINALSANINTDTKVSEGKPSKVDKRDPDIQLCIDELIKLSGSKPRKETLNRYSAKRLITTHGVSRVIRALQYAFLIRDEDRYAPRIYNFMDLEDKWANLVDYGKAHHTKTARSVNISEVLRQKKGASNHVVANP